MSASEDLDKTELMLWTVLRKLEVVALERYRSLVPALAISGKEKVVEMLVSKAPGDQPLEGSPLEEPVRDLLAEAESRDAASTLIVQGLFLERLGQMIYGAVVNNEKTSAATRKLAEVGKAACQNVLDRVPELIREVVGQGEQVLSAITARTHGLLSCLDAMGTGVDDAFKEKFNISFSDLMGDFTAELLPTCTSLGVDRRKLVCHLASGLMGH